MEPDDDHPEDVVWLTRPEVRLVRALSLSVREELGCFSFAPCYSPLAIDPGFRLDDDRTAAMALEALRTASAATRRGGLTYSFNDAGSTNDASSVYDAIDPADDLLMRGLYSLAKAHSFAFAFGVEVNLTEESAFHARVAMQAALDIVLEHLEETGTPAPRAQDAYDYLASVLSPRGWWNEPWIKSNYELFLIAKHPKTRFGPTRRRPANPPARAVRHLGPNVRHAEVKVEMNAISL